MSQAIHDMLYLARALAAGGATELAGLALQKAFSALPPSLPLISEQTAGRPRYSQYRSSAHHLAQHFEPHFRTKTSITGSTD